MYIEGKEIEGYNGESFEISGFSDLVINLP